MRRTAAVMAVLVLAACGSGADGGVAGDAGGAGAPAGCDTAFVFSEPQSPQAVLDAMRGADLLSVEMRYQVESTGTGGGIGSPGYVSSLEDVERSLAAVEEQAGGVPPEIIAVRISGPADGFGDLDDAVHSRVPVPEGAAVALSAPEHGGARVVGGAGGCEAR